MKNLLLITAIASGLATSAFAGNLDTPAPEVVEVTPVVAVTDWSGFYLGGLASFDGGWQQDILTSTGFVNFEAALTGSMYGGFAGYNFQRGSLVFGGEVAYSAGEVHNTPTFLDYGFSDFIDVKGRVGFATGRALLYGVIGGSFGTWHHGVVDTEGTNLGGMSYGVGVDFLLTDRIFAGAEYLVRNISGEIIPNYTISAVEESVQVRVGVNF